MHTGYPESFKSSQEKASFLSIDASLYGYRPEEIGSSCPNSTRYQLHDRFFRIVSPECRFLWAMRPKLFKIFALYASPLLNSLTINDCPRTAHLPSVFHVKTPIQALVHFALLP